MNSSYTIDASVIVSAFSPAEIAHPVSKAFMSQVRDEAAPLIIPTLVLPELASAIARGQGKPELGMAFAEELSRFPNLVLVDLDESLTKLAVEVAAQYRLRGGDAVYAAVALRFGTQLITLDQEQLERLAGVLPVGAP
jgi:predicted nucleic acid-binding protein